MIDSQRPTVVGEVRSLLSFRDLLILMGRRDVTVRYRQTAFGFAWVLVQPVLSALVLSFVFGQVADLPSGELNYFVFALAGLCLWQVFHSLTTRSGMSLLSNAPLLTKTFFPRSVLPVSTVVSTALDFLVSLGLLLAVTTAYGHPPTWRLMLLPLAVLPVAMLGLAAGLLLSALSVQFRDVQQVLPVGLQLLLYASPVAYAAAAVPAGLRQIYDLNPLVGPLTAFRAWTTGSSFDAVPDLARSWAIAALLLLVSAVVFVRRSDRFADVA